MTPSRSWVSPKLRVGRSSIEGDGLFVVEAVTEGERLVELGGRVVEPDALRTLDRYSSFTVDGVTVLQDDDDPATKGNHSCEPTMALAGGLVLVATRPLAPGEEATVDYGPLTGDPAWSMACRCGAPSCRGVVTGPRP